MMSRRLCGTKDEAVRWILAGEVYVDGEPVYNSGKKVPLHASIVIKGKEKRFVSRGGDKLEGAINDFSLSLAGVTALDAGASTGGFTDCMLQHGAKRVYAVDAGYGQLAGRLRADPRVVNLEKTNISAVDEKDLQPIPDFAVADLSYISLKKAIPVLSGLVAPGASLVCLVKPLFETSDREARREGRIRSDDDYTAILNDLARFVVDTGMTPKRVARSRLLGSNGTVEFFLYLSNVYPADVDTVMLRMSRDIDAAVKNGTSSPDSSDRTRQTCR
jgi:23S rRNA (cytidine1920-2'-O)/16S rRNA (cytidine1409-2'-O)-methyltransferase